MASGVVEKVEKWTVREESTTKNGQTEYKKEEERTTEETKNGETKRNSETTREFSTTPAPVTSRAIEDKSADPAVSSSDPEEKKDVYVLSEIDPNENFECVLKDKCLLGDAKKKGTKKMEYKTRQWHEKCFACCVCETPIGTKSFIPREQEIYCVGCYEEKFATRCIKCDKIITTGGVTYKQQPWHRECFTCTNCSTSLAGQRFTSRDDKPYCAECFGELFAKRCTACARPITGIGGTRFISFEDRHWHNDCFICAMCSNSLVGKGFITDGADILCPDCAKQRLM